MVGGGTRPRRRRPGRLLPGPEPGPHVPAPAMLLLVLLLALRPGRCPAQAPGEEEEVKETCGASYNGTYCLAGYPGRGGWAEGLIPDAASSNIYMEPGTWETCEHSSLGSCTASKYQGRWADDFVGLLEFLFLDDGFKLNQGLRGSGQIGHCYYPMVYYLCAHAYPQCKEDKTISVYAPPPPFGAPALVAGSPEAEAEQIAWVKEARLLRSIPLYPCEDFCLVRRAPGRTARGSSGRGWNFAADTQVSLSLPPLRRPCRSARTRSSSP